MISAVSDTCRRAKDASVWIAGCSSSVKNAMLGIVADTLVSDQEEILRSNAADIACSTAPPHFIDRLRLDEQRLLGIADGVRKLIDLGDPIGEIVAEWDADSGIHIVRVRVPLGVVGIIYEARPNVTVDAIALCLKTGNAVVLRGSREAIRSNKAIVEAIKRRLTTAGYNAECIQLIEDTTHEGAEAFMKCREYVDVLIPRGSANLIRTAVEKSTVPVIETGSGNCHAYVESTADFNMATRIILNGKLRRPSVCNALESLLIDRSIAPVYLPIITKELTEKGVEMVGDTECVRLCPEITPATEADYGTEFLSLKISVKIVKDVHDAIAHINRYGTHHSETILTQDMQKAELFLNSVDSAAVYVNASTCFTDGYEFGFGAEMGISTQKLHARGPLGLKELTVEKYKIYGNGQIRK